MTLRPTITVLFSVLLLSASCGKNNPVSGGLGGFYELTRAVIDPVNEPPREQLPPQVSGGLTIRLEGTYKFLFNTANPWPGVFGDKGTFAITSTLITFISTDNPEITLRGQIDADAGTIRIIRIFLNTANGRVFATLTFKRTLSLE